LSDLDQQQVASRATGYFQSCFPSSGPVSRPIFPSKMMTTYEHTVANHDTEIVSLKCNKTFFSLFSWKVEQVSFITGARSVDKRDFSRNMRFFRLPEDSITGNSTYLKLVMRTFDVYANILKCMYITRHNGGATRSETSSDAQPTPCVVTFLTHPMNTLPQSDKYKRRKKESPKERDK
jgi:hypothetical protein